MDQEKQWREEENTKACAECGAPLHIVPAGISKKTHKPYNAFLACPNRHPQSSEKPLYTPGMAAKAEEIKNTLAQSKYIDPSARGKCFYGFALEAYKQGRDLNPTTISELVLWTNAVLENS